MLVYKIYLKKRKRLSSVKVQVSAQVPWYTAATVVANMLTQNVFPLVFQPIIIEAILVEEENECFLSLFLLSFISLVPLPSTTFIA